MPKTSRTRTARASKPTKRKGALPVREAAEVEREVTRGEPERDVTRDEPEREVTRDEPERGAERGRDVERDAPVHRSSEHGPEHQA